MQYQRSTTEPKHLDWTRRSAIRVRRRTSGAGVAALADFNDDFACLLPQINRRRTGCRRRPWVTAGAGASGRRHRRRRLTVCAARVSDATSARVTPDITYTDLAVCVSEPRFPPLPTAFWLLISDCGSGNKQSSLLFCRFIDFFVCVYRMAQKCRSKLCFEKLHPFNYCNNSVKNRPILIMFW